MGSCPMLPSLYHQGYGRVVKLCLPADVRAIANWSSEQRHSRVCAPDGCDYLDGARVGSQLPKLPSKKSSHRGRTEGKVLRRASKSTWASGLMRRRKPSCLPMARRLQSIGSTTIGLALLAATCHMSSTVKTAILRTQAPPRRTVLRRSQSGQATAKLQQVRRNKQTTRLAARFPARHDTLVRLTHAFYPIFKLAAALW